MTSEIDRQIRSPQCTVKRVSIIIELTKPKIYDTFRVQLTLQTDKNCRRSDEHIPPEWIVVNDDYPLLVPIKDDSDEYRTILEDFREIKMKHLIQHIRIERIQNRRLYCQYQAEKQYLEEQLKEDTERRLFHGFANQKKTIESITKHGFDRSLASYSHGKCRLTDQCTDLHSVFRPHVRQGCLFLHSSDGKSQVYGGGQNHQGAHAIRLFGVTRQEHTGPCPYAHLSIWIPFNNEQGFHLCRISGCSGLRSILDLLQMILQFSSTSLP